MPLLEKGLDMAVDRDAVDAQCLSQFLEGGRNARAFLGSCKSLQDLKLSGGQRPGHALQNHENHEQGGHQEGGLNLLPVGGEEVRFHRFSPFHGVFGLGTPRDGANRSQ